MRFPDAGSRRSGLAVAVVPAARKEGQIEMEEQV